MRVPPLNRRDFLKHLTAGALACCAGGGCRTLADAAAPAAGAAPARRPNILLVMADDMGFADAGCFGGEIATPNLDRLAAQGLRFTQHYSTGRCWPSRSTLLTGYYAQQLHADPPVGLFPLWSRLLSHHLRGQGYRSYHSGKWHLRGLPLAVQDGGFDHSYVLHDHDRFFSPQDHQLDDKPLAAVPADKPSYVTKIIADHAITFLQEHAREHAAQPFFLYLAFTSPHFPLQAPAEDIARYASTYTAGWDAVRAQRWQRQRALGVVNCALSEPDPACAPNWNLDEQALRTRVGPGEVGHAVPWATLNAEQQAFQARKMAVHAAMIDRMDREIGRVLEQVRRMGAYEDTVVVFLSDNGASAEQIIRGEGHDPQAAPGSARTFLGLGPGWSTAANAPFRRHKHWVHEGGVASPCIVQWPAGIAARGELRHTPGHFVDWVPTLLELAGVAALPAASEGAPRFPGRSLAPAFGNPALAGPAWIFFSHSGNRGLRCGDWKVAADGAKGPWELYDLKTDRCEMVNLAAAQPEKVRELTARWRELEQRFAQDAGPVRPADKPGRAREKPDRG